MISLFPAFPDGSIVSVALTQICRQRVEQAAPNAQLSSCNDFLTHLGELPCCEDDPKANLDLQSSGVGSKETSPLTNFYGVPSPLFAVGLGCQQHLNVFVARPAGGRQYPKPCHQVRNPYGQPHPADMGPVPPPVNVRGIGNRDPNDPECWVWIVCNERRYQVKLNVQLVTVEMLMHRIAMKERIPISQFILKFQDRVLQDLAVTLSEAGIRHDASIEVQRLTGGSGGVIAAYSVNVDSHFDQDYRMPDDGDRRQRGGHDYHRPWGWMRYGLNVYGRDTDNAWIGPAGRSRRDSAPGEWPVAYIGSKKSELENAYNRIRLTTQDAKNYAGCILTAPRIEDAHQLADIITHQGIRYKVVFQARVHPDKINVTQFDNKTFWAFPDRDDVRVYGLLVKSVDNQNYVENQALV